MSRTVKAWLAGGLAGMLVVLALGWLLLVNPKKNDVSAVRANVDTVLAANNHLRDQIRQLLAQQQQIIAKQIRLAQIAKRIPGDPQLPSLIRRLSQDAHSANVDLVSFTPTAPAVATAALGLAAPYQQITLTMEVHGTYASLEEWFRNLESSSSRLIVVEKVDLKPTKPATGQVTTVTLGPGGIPESSKTITAVLSARTFLTSPATITADLPALSGKS